MKRTLVVLLLVQCMLAGPVLAGEAVGTGYRDGLEGFVAAWPHRSGGWPAGTAVLDGIRSGLARPLQAALSGGRTTAFIRHEGDPRPLPRAGALLREGTQSDAARKQPGRQPKQEGDATDGPDPDPDLFAESDLLQAGNGNVASLEQVAEEGNAARIEQWADHNVAGQFQSGSHNSASIVQTTGFNAARQYQQGIGNSAVIAQ